MHVCLFFISTAVLQLIYYDFDNFALINLNAHKNFKKKYFGIQEWTVRGNVCPSRFLH